MLFIEKYCHISNNCIEFKEKKNRIQTETEPIRKAIYETKVAPPGITPRFISMENGVKEMKKVYYVIKDL